MFSPGGWTVAEVFLFFYAVAKSARGKHPGTLALSHEHKARHSREQHVN